MSDRRTVVVIHTGPVTVAPIGALAAELVPNARIINLVDDSLLKDAMAAGEVTPAIRRRLAQYMTIGQEMGADVILNVCSSVGEAADAAASLLDIPMLKIDSAMAEQAVGRAERIGVAATVQTTLDPTARLVENAAARLGKSVHVVRQLCEGAFEALLTGDAARHDEIVGRHLAELAAKVDLIVLAQVSMARVAAGLGDRISVPVLDSPRLGVERLAALLVDLDKSSSPSVAA